MKNLLSVLVFVLFVGCGVRDKYEKCLEYRNTIQYKYGFEYSGEYEKRNGKKFEDKVYFHCVDYIVEKVDAHNKAKKDKWNRKIEELRKSIKGVSK